MFSNITRKAFIAPALLLAGGALYAAPATPTAQSQAPAAIITIVTVTPEYPSADEATNLLKQIRTDAAQLSQDGATLATLSRSGISGKTHAIYLNGVKARINATGQMLSRLEQIKDGAAPWQQEAIDQLTPIAQEVASNTQAAIVQLNGNSQRLLTPDYTESLRAIAASASDLSHSISGYLSVAAINEKADRLHDKAYQLELKADELQTKLNGSNS